MYNDNISTFIPATRSRTATLLRLHPNHQFRNRLSTNYKNFWKTIK